MSKRKGQFPNGGPGKKHKPEVLLTMESFEGIPNEVIANFMIQGGVKAARAMALHNPLFAQVLADPVVRKRVCSELKEENTAFVKGNLERNLRAIVDLVKINGRVDFYAKSKKHVCICYVKLNPDNTYDFHGIKKFQKLDFEGPPMVALGGMGDSGSPSDDELTDALWLDLEKFEEFGTKLTVKNGGNLRRLYTGKPLTEFPIELPFYSPTNTPYVGGDSDDEEEDHNLYYIDPKYIELSDDQTYKVNPMCRDLFLNQ